MDELVQTDGYVQCVSVDNVPTLCNATTCIDCKQYGHKGKLIETNT